MWGKRPLRNLSQTYCLFLNFLGLNDLVIATLPRKKVLCKKVVTPYVRAVK